MDKVLDFPSLQHQILQSQRCKKKQIQKLSSTSVYNLLQSSPWFSNSIEHSSQSVHRQAWVLDVRDNLQYQAFRLRGAEQFSSWYNLMMESQWKIHYVVSFLLYHESQDGDLNDAVQCIHQSTLLVDKIFILQCPFSQFIKDFQHLKDTCLFESNLQLHSINHNFVFPSCILANHQLYLAYQDVYSFLVSPAFRKLNLSAVLDVSYVPLISETQTCQYISLGDPDALRTTQKKRQSMSLQQLYHAVDLLGEWSKIPGFRVLVCSHDNQTRGCFVVLGYFILCENRSFEMSYLHLLTRFVHTTLSTKDIALLRQLENKKLPKNLSNERNRLGFHSVFQTFQQDIIENAKDLFALPEFWNRVSKEWSLPEKIKEAVEKVSALSKEDRERIHLLMLPFSKNLDALRQQKHTLQEIQLEEDFLTVVFQLLEWNDTKQREGYDSQVRHCQLLYCCFNHLYEAPFDFIWTYFNPLKLIFSTHGKPSLYILYECWLLCFLNRQLQNKPIILSNIDPTLQEFWFDLSADLHLPPRILSLISFVFYLDSQQNNSCLKHFVSNYLPHLVELSTTSDFQTNQPTVCLMLSVLGVDCHLRSKRPLQHPTQYTATKQDFLNEKRIILYTLCRIWFERDDSVKELCHLENSLRSPAYLLKGLLYTCDLIMDYFHTVVKQTTQDSY